MRHLRVVACVLLVVFAVAAQAAAAPEGQLTWGVHISLRPPGSILPRPRASSRPSLILYAIRRNGQGDAREHHRAEPGRIVADLA
jgi:hypothetical protein